MTATAKQKACSGWVTTGQGLLVCSARAGAGFALPPTQVGNLGACLSGGEREQKVATLLVVIGARMFIGKDRDHNRLCYLARASGNNAKTFVSC